MRTSRCVEPAGSQLREVPTWEFSTGCGGGDVRVRPRAADQADVEHLERWAATRIGVEAYVEPRTAVTETTVVLVAHDGEWTRRRIDGAEGARRLGKRLKVPVYDVAKVGYPQQMRDYTARQRMLREREDSGAD